MLGEFLIHFRVIFSMYQKKLNYKIKLECCGITFTMSTAGVIDVEVVGEALATKNITNNNNGDDEVLRTPDSGYSSISTPSSR